ncbi:hypothetical protein, partial [Evtepia sp.]|uniref:hypothetical protein n=1 Tax=Evtepia sp. TaxID=2773933 RepID=UPI002E763E79
VKKTSRLVTFRLLPYSKSVKLICFSISFTSLPYFTAISQKIKSVFTQGEAFAGGMPLQQNAFAPNPCSRKMRIQIRARTWVTK